MAAAPDDLESEDFMLSKRLVLVLKLRLGVESYEKKFNPFNSNQPYNICSYNMW